MINECNVTEYEIIKSIKGCLLKHLIFISDHAYNVLEKIRSRWAGKQLSEGIISIISINIY